MKRFIKQLIPPIAINFYIKLLAAKKKTNNIITDEIIAWTGNYSSWQQAKEHTTGYDDKEILEKCKNALLKVKNGEAKYERDSVLFDEIEYSWPLLAALQRCALENNNTLCVLDFGGSLGSTYFQNKSFLSGVKVSWNIVEQKIFVETGKKFFEDETLKFFYTIEESLQHQQPNVIILSSVLQYLPGPYDFIQKLLMYNFSHIILDRTGFEKKHGRDVLTVQNVPALIYKASYPCWFFNEQKLINAFAAKYDVVSGSADSFTSDFIHGDNHFYWKGFFLENKNGQ
ncbi:MAG: methyltransferase, TIGR04325 family [Chitinophagaceae bacterium]